MDILYTMYCHSPGGADLAELCSLSVLVRTRDTSGAIYRQFSVFYNHVVIELWPGMGQTYRKTDGLQLA